MLPMPGMEPVRFWNWPALGMPPVNADMFPLAPGMLFTMPLKSLMLPTFGILGTLGMLGMVGIVKPPF